MGSENYGKYFWEIIKQDCIVMANADGLKVGETGELILFQVREDGILLPTVIYPKGEWLSVCAASVVDGHAVAIDNIYPKSSFISKRASSREREKLTHKLRLEVLQRDGFKCKVCGSGKDDGAILEVDHIIPVSRGGKTVIDNLQTLCHSCNHGKGTQILPAAPNKVQP